MSPRPDKLPVVILLVSVFLHLALADAAAATAEATVNSISTTAVGPSVGTITFTDTAGGLLITPKLSRLPPGEHGFHIHEKGECGPGINEGKPAAGFAAGGHYDPAHSKKHLGPFSTGGHRGDLPVLVVDSRGDATKAVTAPHLTVAEIRGRSIMIHAGGDNYSDAPAPLGGGGQQVCRYWPPRQFVVITFVLAGFGSLLTMPITPGREALASGVAFAEQGGFYLPSGEARKIVTVTKTGKAKTRIRILTEAVAVKETRSEGYSRQIRRGLCLQSRLHSGPS